MGQAQHPGQTLSNANGSGQVTAAPEGGGIRLTVAGKAAHGRLGFADFAPATMRELAALLVRLADEADARASAPAAGE